MLIDNIREFLEGTMEQRIQYKSTQQLEALTIGV